MSDPVLVALLGLIGSGAGSFAGVISSARLTQYRLEQLENKVQAHNSFDKRLHELERRADVHDEKIKEVESRLDDMATKMETLKGAKKR